MSLRLLASPSSVLFRSLVSSAFASRAPVAAQFHISSALNSKKLDLKEIYPDSSLDFTEKQQVPITEGLNFSGYIPIDSLQITYSRSSGPGGQHVNTTSSKVDLRFKVESADWLTPELKEKLVEKYPQSVNKDGFFIVKSDKTRSQHLNLADCLDKLRKIVWESAKVPEPPSEESIERKRRLLERAARNRLVEKRVRSAIKANRQQPQF